MFTVQRIYAYQPDSKQTAVFIDRLYPRGIHKEVFATALWLKDITPSANLRRWYHENPTQNFDGFVSRYHEELHGDTEQAAIKRLLEAGEDVPGAQLVRGNDTLTLRSA